MKFSRENFRDLPPVEILEGIVLTQKAFKTSLDKTGETYDAGLYTS